MQIDNEQQYQDTMTELKLFEEAPVADEAVQQRRRELKAAAKYTETAEECRTAQRSPRFSLK